MVAFRGVKNNGKLLNHEAKRWSLSFSRASIYRVLTEKVLVVCIHGRLEEDVVYNRDIARDGLTVIFVVFRRDHLKITYLAVATPLLKMQVA